MKLPRRTFLHLAAGAVALPALSQIAPAQAYPSRPIRLVIPYPPGGVNDAVGRPWADKMKALLGTVVVENMGGAGGSLGAAAVSRAQPDGYTILLGNAGTQVINPLATSRPAYDPIKSFDSIAILGFTAVSLAVHPAIPVRTVKELLDYAKANPGKLSYGSPGAGSMSHLAGELFKSLTSLHDVLHVPYRGMGPAITDAIAGQIAMITPNVTGQIIELHNSGKLRLLAVTSPKRLGAAPQIPTAIEGGIPRMVAQNFIGLFAPARTPKPVVEQIAQATRAAMADQNLQKMYLASGFAPAIDSNAEKTQQLINEEIVRWTPIIKSIGLNLD